MAKVERQILEQLAELILHCADHDQKLPTEQEMMERFNISRFTLREALSFFEVNGMVTSLQGSGRICRYPDIGEQINHIWSLLVKFRPTMLLDFLDVRRALELSSVSIVIQNLRSDDLMKLRELTRQMMECAEHGRSFSRYDREFHCTLFDCTGNTIFRQMLTAFWDLCEMTIEWPQSGNSIEVVQQHIEILEAFACRNEELASNLLSKQFDEARNRIALALLK